MPKADEPNDQAPQSLDARIAAFEARKAAEQPKRAEHEKSSTDGYRLLADLIGGVLAGLGLGWAFDGFAGTKPWGMVGGLLIGMGFSIYLVVRKATKLSAQASASTPSKGKADGDTGGGSTAPKQKRD
jgi:ATP synthase protein I